MKEDELADLLKKNPLYGRIVCRCEKVSAAEIIDSKKAMEKVYELMEEN